MNLVTRIASATLLLATMYGGCGSSQHRENITADATVTGHRVIYKRSVGPITLFVLDKAGELEENAALIQFASNLVGISSDGYDHLKGDYTAYFSYYENTADPGKSLYRFTVIHQRDGVKRGFSLNDNARDGLQHDYRVHIRGPFYGDIDGNFDCGTIFTPDGTRNLTQSELIGASIYFGQHSRSIMEKTKEQIEEVKDALGFPAG
jgi:hypothetical protein